MSRSAVVRQRFFGEGYFDFKLGIGEADLLQDQFDCGLMEMLERIAMVRTRDIKEVLRLGLIGGGMDKEAAFNLVERQVRPGYLAEAAKVAIAVIEAAVRGAPDEPLGESQGEGDDPSPTAKFDTANSTASASPPD